MFASLNGELKRGFIYSFLLPVDNGGLPEKRVYNEYCMKYKGILASSADPSGETLSTTVRGVIIGASSIIIFLGVQFFHVQITVDDVAMAATQVSMLISSGVAIYGIIMKIVHMFGTTV